MTIAKAFLNQSVVIEIAPAAVFFITNYTWGIAAATIAVSIATTVSILLGYYVNKRFPLIAITTLVIVLILSGASLLLDDFRFVKMKPTIGKSLFALTLLVGLIFRPTFLQRVLGGYLFLLPTGWRVLTVAWAGFATTLAVANEVVWRNSDTDTWVSVETALAPISIVGYILITRLIASRYWNATEENWPSASSTSG